MSAARDDRGFTLVELLVAMLMTTVVMAAVVLLFTSFINNNRYDQFREDAQYNAQTIIDRMSRDIRDAAAPSTGASTIQKAGNYDILFQEVSASGAAPSGNASNEEWVRYCLDSNLTLWRQTTTPSSTTSTLPDTSACPSTSNAWVTTGGSGSPCCQELNDITNEINGDTTRPLFVYGPSGASPTSAIKSVQVAVYLDKNTSHLPGATAITSGVFLRNALQSPTANFTPTQTVNSSTSTAVQLNGSFSTDPNGQALSYQWYSALNCPSANAIANATSQQYNAGSYNPNTTPTQAFSLQVTDTAGLTSCASQTVTIQ